MTVTFSTCHLYRMAGACSCYASRRALAFNCSMLIDKALQDYIRRSSSAWAKYALTNLRISLALRNSLFSRSSSFKRCRSVVATPALVPVSISSPLTYSLSVCDTHPILRAMVSMVPHRGGYSPRCSCTSLTTRSRTSDENLFVLFMTQSSQ